MGNLKIFKQPKGLPDSTSTSTSDGYLEIKIMRVEVMDQVAWPIGTWWLTPRILFLVQFTPVN